MCLVCLLPSEYRLLHLLGSGCIGRVYLVYDMLLDCTVVVKFIPAPDAHSLARFLVEAQTCARIQHPNIATLYHAGQLGDRTYLVSKFVRDTSLNQIAKPLD